MRTKKLLSNPENMATNQQIPVDIGCSQSAVQPNTNSTPFALLQMAKDLHLGSAAEHKNFVFSPCSIQLCMSLLAHGARGPTLDELLTFSQLQSLDDLKSVASKMVAALTESSEMGPKLSLVGGAWIDHSLRFNSEFIACSEEIYKVKAETVDFKNEVKAQEVVDKVNKWAEEATDGLINSVLPKLDPNTTLVLANALYFKGLWKELFRKSLTKESDFYLHDGKTLQVPFMSSTRDQIIQTFPDFKVLRLPYKKDTKRIGAALSMYIILPHERDGLWSVIQKMGIDPNFLEKYTDLYTTEVKVGKFMVPKFRIAFDFEASEFLKGVGVEKCFGVEAELNDMVADRKLNEQVLYVSRIHHKAYIEINEQGTEAAAVNVVQLRRCCGRVRPPMIPIDFVADHPFMFLIKNDVSGMVLFLGHVINPTLQNENSTRHAASDGIPILRNRKRTWDAPSLNPGQIQPVFNRESIVSSSSDWKIHDLENLKDGSTHPTPSKLQLTMESKP